MNLKTRRLLMVGGFIVAIPLIAWVGYTIARASRMTADKVSQYADDIELNGLSGAARAEALKRLEQMIQPPIPGRTPQVAARRRLG